MDIDSMIQSTNESLGFFQKATTVALGKANETTNPHKRQIHMENAVHMNKRVIALTNYLMVLHKKRAQGIK